MKNLKLIPYLLSVVILSVMFSGCGSNQQKETGDSNVSNPEMLAQFQKEQADLLAKANEELSSLNKKILELNEKIKENGGKLTDAQNEAIDAFEEKRASVNKCMHQIKNISQDGWGEFKTTFEKDLEEVKGQIDAILAGL